MNNFGKKNAVKIQLVAQKRTSYVEKQPQIRQDKPKNKIGYNYHVDLNKIKQLEFDFNPVVVTRRNISTAQTKRHQYQDDDEDLLLTSNFIRKKQPTAHTTSHFHQTVKETFKKTTQRPQSKKQSRSHVWDNNNALLLKNTGTQLHRPQTSKGQRPKPMDKSRVSVNSSRKISEDNEFMQSELKQEQKNDMGSKGSQTSRIVFKSSIDADFLSLFAS